MKRLKYKMANTLNCREIFYKFGSSRKQKEKLLAEEALNFRVLMDCWIFMDLLFA